MLGSTSPILADVTYARYPQAICAFAGSWSPQLVTQTMVSWYATKGSHGNPGDSVIAVLDPFTGASTVAATWTGGELLDGLHSWSPDRGFLAYVTSDPGAVKLHLLSAGGDRVVATMGPVTGRGVNPNDDDAFLGFSPDGAYFALVQTFTSSGDQLQIRRTTDGSIAYSQPSGTMATWGSTGSRLYFRQPNGSVVSVWDPSTGTSQALKGGNAWIRPRADAGDDYLAFTERDAAGTPHVWTFGQAGRAGGQLPNVRSSPVFLNNTSLFYVEEASCGTNCGPGPATQPDGKTFTYDIGRQAEDPSRISQVLFKKTGDERTLGN